MKHPQRFKFPWQPGPTDKNSGATKLTARRHGGASSKRDQQDVDEFLRKIDENKTLNLSVLDAGDSLKITTRNTTYTFQMLGPREAVLSTNRIDRPSGPARLRGCTFGRSSTISPDHIFCGGNLEFLFNPTQKIHQTTEITAIFWIRRARQN